MAQQTQPNGPTPSSSDGSTMYAQSRNDDVADCIADAQPKKNLLPTGKETRAELLARVEANMRAPQ